MGFVILVKTGIQQLVDMAQFIEPKCFTYKLSTFSLAQGVLRRNFRLDLMLGSWVKQLRLMISPNPSQP